MGFNENFSEFLEGYTYHKQGWLQLGTSSRAKHGGAYFSAVFGRKFDPCHKYL